MQKNKYTPSIPLHKDAPFVHTPRVTSASPPAADLSRRERRKLEVRTRIVDASLELFAEQGFHNATVASICERADVAHKTFFNHFPTKQDVMNAVASDSIDGLLAAIEEAREAGRNTQERLKLFFSYATESVAEAGPMQRELMIELIQTAQKAEDDSQPARHLHEGFGAIVAQGMREGDIDSTHPAATITDLILGAYYALIFNWANLENFPIEQRAQAAARFLSDAIASKRERR